jgi:uncharacterized membrane protein YgdD (TMEM256/DUF423 family)
MRKLFIVAAGLGASGVILGALGAHAWREALESRAMVATWETAVLYHLVHAVAGLAAALGALAAPSASRALTRAALLWAAGVLLFSGSLYGLSLGGPRLLGPITPLGGLFLIAGWLSLLTVKRPSGPTVSS